MEENRTKVCCESDCYYLIDNGTRCQYGKNIELEVRKTCSVCEGYETTIAKEWGICSKGLFIHCCDYFCDDFEEDEENDEDY